ncbi:hypothetical protein GCM10008985_01420 [Halococcus dombrowskii]|uniref:Transposase n=1 Tax=Halococcus dombrowskii TaxID=179637 RepID=A0AAV3SCM7_HALDO
MRSIDDDELTAMFVIGKQLATHRLEAISEFIGMKFVEGPPERRPIRDVLWLSVVESLSKRMIALKTAFEGVEGVALELPQDKCGSSFGRD